MNDPAAGQLKLALAQAPPIQERVSRRARRIRVELRPDGTVVLTIPLRVSRGAAYRFLEESRPWIARQQVRRASRPLPPPLRWDGSDHVPLRGKAMALKLMPSALRKPAVRIEEQTLYLYAPPGWCDTPVRLRRVLLSALKAEAERDARRMLDEESARLGLNYRGLTVRDPRSRWGSCAADGRIMLSWRLVMAPAEVFRYVVIHELCHLRWRGHGPRFWNLVAQQMPEFENQRSWLRRHGDELLAQAR